MSSSRPIAVFQHTEVGAPGAVVPILESLGREVMLIRVVDGEAVPTDAGAFGGLVFMGGHMSVHDPLPWISQELALIRQADACGIPVAGHCLGSQLVALALGGQVGTNERPEIGWCEMVAENSAVARAWWGPHAGRVLTTFQWHGDTFVPPHGAERIAHSRYCANQAYVVHGRHLLVQSHLEMTPPLVELSIERNGHQLQRQNALRNPAVSSYDDITNALPQRTAQMHTLLAQLYTRWVLADPRCGANFR
jgi:GMP synthase-like glutamine amidotransferase